MASFQMLSPELHRIIFSYLPNRQSLLSIILSCKAAHYSFLSSYLPAILEDIRFQEIGCGVYADALIYSFRLLEPDIGVEHIREYTASFRAATIAAAAAAASNDDANNEENIKTNVWSSFIDSLPETSLPWTDWQENNYRSSTSTYYFNQLQTSNNSILPPSSCRWWTNYRLVRLLAHQCAHLRLRQGLGEENDDYTNPSTPNPGQQQQPPPTESELRRFERGIYALWIMINIGSLTHRPDFLRGIFRRRHGEYTNTQRLIQRNLRRDLISVLNVWDWRVAMSIREYMVARLAHLDIMLRKCRTKVIKPMWDGLPQEYEQRDSNYDEITDNVMAAFSPPGAMRYFFADRIVTDIDPSNLYAGAAKDSRQIQSYIEIRTTSANSSRPVPLHISERLRIRKAISKFADFEWFMSAIRKWDNRGEALNTWIDIKTFYTIDEYPIRSRLPLETPRSIIKSGHNVFRGPKTRQKDGQDYDELEDYGWAWRRCVDWDRCMWDDWRLERFAHYHKPEKRELICLEDSRG